MKKIFFIVVILSLFLLTGCGKYNEKSIVKEINKKINSMTGYQVEGDMEIYNGEDVYKYDVISSYENDNYRVSLTNKSNNHEQIILRNADGVYVLTPSLNKSFKFQSNWPNNSSQVYILQSLQNDMNEDESLKLEQSDNGYMLTLKLANSNNKNLVSQKIYLDKKLNFTKVEVFDELGNKQIKMNFKSVDTKATFNNKYFSTSENMKTSEDTSNNENDSNSKNNNSKTEKSDETTILEESIYPMYLPSGTYLSEEESVSKEDGDRIIMTFAGESPFILVEESIASTQEMEIIPVNGEPTMLMDTIGALSESSVNFISNGVEYYIASESLTTQEIIQVAESINSIPVMK